MRRKLTAETARKLLSYDVTTGILTWKIDRKGGARAGQIAGHKTKEGYINVCVERVLYAAHQVIWLIVYGEWPEGILDHRDGDKSNNRIENLRQATHAENSRNQNLSRRSTSGVRGVVWNKAVRKWQAQIQIDGRTRYLGVFSEKSKAAEARASAERELFGDFGRFSP